MADVTITASAVLAGTGAVKEQGVAGEAFDAGDFLYKDATTSKWMKADNTTATKAAASGVALTTAAVAEAPCVVQTSGAITLGSVLTKGEVYVIGAGAGNISPAADNGSAEFCTIAGIAASATSLILGFLASGVAKD